jgi:ribonuclease P protein component
VASCLPEFAVVDKRVSVLPAVYRMHRAGQFASVIRRGTRVRRGCVVVHHLSGAEPAGPATVPVVGLVVSKAVGSSVVRHRVSRRLRAQLAQRVAGLPAGAAIVVRALPEAATATSATVGADIDAAFARLALTGAGRTR